ncbi:hypothetical protein [Pseudomonas sp. SJZ131]|uniref:hypothetical protein n=1 Tax=Pseudomonas sp. SJZ131 TaxID=2572895 RepID=UPI00119BA53F|nr:hypothetical protein [Pseudomonas sp. SJZ131]TWD45521.1 hypothetical protein FBY12_4278 [Pseudomonas sp. SJZ131]
MIDSSDALETPLDTAPYIHTPQDFSKVSGSALLTINGAGHARRRVRVVTPGLEDALSLQMEMGGDGHFTLTLSNLLAPGVHKLQILQWDMYSDSHRRSPIMTVMVEQRPVVGNPSLVFDTTKPNIRVSGIPGATVQVVRHPEGTALSSAHQLTGAQAIWVPITVAMGPGLQRIAVKQTYPDFAGNTMSFAVEIWIVLAPTITQPLMEPPTKEQRPVISGTGGIPGAKVEVSITGGTPVLRDATVMDNGAWSGTSQHTFALGLEHKLTTRQIYSGIPSQWSADHLFYLVGPPTITVPASKTIEITSVFNGTAPAGFWQNRIELFRAENDSLGTQLVTSATGAWSKSVVLTPGPQSITATHTYRSVTSIRSTAILFLVRPATPTISSRLKGTEVELHGTGHSGANVLMHVHFNGDGTNVFLEAAINSGTWAAVIPASLTPGNYNFTGRQSVSDGGSGRIFNSGWAVGTAVNIPTPVPVVPTVTVTGQRPRFSGTGRQWGTSPVQIIIYNNNVLLANVPQASVQPNLSWTTTATADLPPGIYSKLTARQWVNNQYSADSAEFSMTVPISPPIFINPPVEAISGQRPQISGSAWPGSSVSLSIPGRGDVPLTATGGSFVLDATEDWAPATYLLTAIANYGGQGSTTATRQFTVKTPPPIFTTPDNSEVDLTPVIKGRGFNGCWIIVYSVTHGALGQGPVDENGEWSVHLTERAPGNLTVYAIQKEDRNSSNDSQRSAQITVQVRVSMPLVQVPPVNGRPGRTSVFSGTATVGGTVELGIRGQAPLKTGIVIDADGQWQTSVTLLPGATMLEVRVRQKNYLSEPREHLVTVVPNQPVIDSPRDGEAVGRTLRASGFGYPGDEIRIDRRLYFAYLGATTVLPDGTWSTSVTQNIPGEVKISAIASAGPELTSVYSDIPTLPVLKLPAQIVEPLAGDWVGVRPQFSGLATPGAVINVASWFNTDELLAPSTVADALGRWTVIGNTDMPVGAARVMARQTIDDLPSEWVEGGRFMVERVLAEFEPPTVLFPRMGQEVGRYPVWEGRGAVGAEVTIIKAREVDTVLARTRVDRDGRWAVQSQVQLPVSDLPFSCSVRQSRDGATSKWLQPNREFKVIQVAPEFDRPIIDQPGDNETQPLEQRPLFAGRGMPGAEIKVCRHDRLTDVYATTQVDARGNWSVRGSELVTGAHQVTCVQTIDGQQSAASDIVINFTVARKVSMPRFNVPATGAQVSPVAVLTGTALPGAVVVLVRAGSPNTEWGRGPVDEHGQWVIVTRAMPLGNFSVTGKAYHEEMQSGWMLALDLQVIDVG